VDDAGEDGLVGQFGVYSGRIGRVAVADDGYLSRLAVLGNVPDDVFVEGLCQAASAQHELSLNNPLVDARADASEPFDSAACNLPARVLVERCSRDYILVFIAVLDEATACDGHA
jgi:hypothetical protein